MSHASAVMTVHQQTSRLNYQSIFDSALVAYKKKTGKDLRAYPLFSKLETCGSPDAVLITLREQIPVSESGFDHQAGSGHDSDHDSTPKIAKWLDPTVNVLFAFSAVIGAGASLTYPPAGVVFGAIGVLLSTAKAVSSGEGALVSLFGRIESFFRRLEVYIEVPSIAGMKDTMVRIMMEVLSILAIATKEIKRNRATTFLKKLSGRSDIEDALQRLDRLTQEEGWMAAAQGLGTTHRVEAQVTKGVEKITQEIGGLTRNQQRQGIRAWLSPPDPSSNFNIASDARHEGTATWFTQSNTFNHWKEASSFLWMHGKPGSGKSVLASAIIHHIRATSNVALAHISYFFFDFKDTGKQDARALLSSILVQLSNQSDSFCDILLELYSAHHQGSQQPSDSELILCLEAMLGVPGQIPIYIIIDALDECPMTTGMSSPRRKVLALIEKLVNSNSPNLRLCITSRPEIDIRNCLEPLKPTRVSLHDENGQKQDIFDFVRKEVYSDINMRKWRDDDKILVIEMLSERADGMFRWVACQLENLRHCIPSSVRRILAELPETLDETYERIMREIPKANREYAHRLLQCLTVASRPLRVDELAEVLALDFSDAGEIPVLKEDLRWEDQEQAVLSACSSLIIVIDNGRSRVVQFSHFSVKESLTSGRLGNSQADVLRYHDIRLDGAHTMMAKACLGTLLRFDHTIDVERIQGFPLAVYAATHFGDHADSEDVISQLQFGIDELLDAEKPHFAAWLWIERYHYAFGDRSSLRWVNEHPEQPEGVPLYYMAELGFRGLVQYLILTRPQDVTSSVGDFGTPLHGAVRSKQVEVLKLLLEHCVDVDIRDSDGRTPLHLATAVRSLEIIRVLIERGANINAQDKYSQTALHRILDSLLSLGTLDIDLEPMKFLLQHGADVDAQDISHSTPLHMASCKGSPNVVQMLLEYGANIHAQDKQGQTPLHRLLENFHFAEGRGTDTLCVLLAHGANVDSHDDDHSTPLHIVSYKGRLEAVQILLEHGANVHARNSLGQIPLHRSSKNLGPFSPQESVDVMRTLLAHGSDVDAHDNDHSTPLHFASYHGSLEAVQLLLEHGANVHTRDSQGRTPLHGLRKSAIRLSSRDEDLAFMRALLSHGADVDAQDNDHSTPLHTASYDGSLEIVKALLEHGASVHARDNQGQTPLHRSLKNPDNVYHRGHFDVIEILLAHGADVNAQDHDDSTPLHIASSQGCKRAVGALLSRRANVHLRNDQGRTPLHESLKSSDHVYHSGYHDVIQNLLMYGADVNAQDVDGTTPLHLSSSQGSSKHTKLLLSHGADVRMENKKGETAFEVASVRGHHQTVLWLLMEHARGERGM